MKRLRLRDLVAINSHCHSFGVDFYVYNRIYYYVLINVLKYPSKEEYLMKNVQISFDENLLSTVDRIASSANLSRSAVVREALQAWIREREVKQFEEEWIRKLKENPPDLDDSDAWIEVEQWGDS
jgi:Arc/MetJ-type ribon-helix-helix transcriptional regulator